MTPKKAARLLKKAGAEYFHDNVPGLGAALAFYSMLSIGPLLLIVLGLAGLFFGHEAAQARLVAEVSYIIGPEGAKAVRDLLNATTMRTSTNVAATVFGLVTLLIGASGTFAQLRFALNIIWKADIKPDPNPWHILKQRALTFSMMIGTCFLLLVSLIVTTALAAMTDWLAYRFSDVAAWTLPLLDAILNVGVLSLLFALIFKYLPDAKVKWDDVWWGALLTAVLFILGKSAIGFYLGHSGLSSSYGAAGSFVVLLFWVYYSAQILFFGAEFTQVYAKDSVLPRLSWWQKLLRYVRIKD